MALEVYPSKQAYIDHIKKQLKHLHLDLKNVTMDITINLIKSEINKLKRQLRDAQINLAVHDMADRMNKFL